MRTALGATVEYVYDGFGRVIETKNRAAGDHLIGTTIVHSAAPTKLTTTSTSFADTTATRTRRIDLSAFVQDADSPAKQLRYTVQNVEQPALFNKVEIIGSDLVLTYADNAVTPSGNPSDISLQVYDPTREQAIF